MKIYTPVKNATGTWCTVRFVNGIGETNDPHLIEWFRNHGYRMEESVVSKPIIETLNEMAEPDFESMTPIELREWAKANGLGSKIKNIRTKDKLLEIIRG